MFFRLCAKCFKDIIHLILASRLFGIYHWAPICKWGNCILERIISFLKVIQLLDIRAGSLDPSLTASRAHVLNLLTLLLLSKWSSSNTGWNPLAQSTRPLLGWPLPVFRHPVLLFLSGTLRFRPTNCKPSPQVPYFFYYSLHLHTLLFSHGILYVSKITVYMPIFPWENSHSSKQNTLKS